MGYAKNLLLCAIGSLAASLVPACDSAPAPSAPDATPEDSSVNTGDGGQTPDILVPDAALPDAALPDAALPDAALPDAALPDAALPDATLPDAALPDAALPDAMLPDAARPDAALPDAALPPIVALKINEIDCRGSDWVEVFNPTAAPIPLDGWALTDRPADATRGQGLSGVLDPGAFVVTPTEGEALSFGISCGDDTLSLIDPFGRLVDVADVGDTGRRTTWGRLPDGAANWATLRPTPGAPNRPLAPIEVVLNEVDCQGRDRVELLNLGDERVDLEGWLLTDDLEDPDRAYPIELNLDPGEYGVLKQQTPQEIGFRFGIRCGASTLYLMRPDGRLADQVAVPAVPAAFNWGRLPNGEGDWGPVAQTVGNPNTEAVDPAADVFDPLTVLEINLTLEPAAMEALSRQPREWVPGTFQVVGEHPEPLPVGLRLKGRAGSFRTLDQKSGFKVKTNLFDRSLSFHGMRKLTFNNMVQDASNIHEWAAYEIFRAMGVPAPRIGYAFIRLNGEIYGLYGHIETPDTPMFERYFADTNHVYEGAYGQDFFAQFIGQFDVDAGDSEDRDDLIQIQTLLDTLTPEAFFEATQALIDWPEVTRAMAVEIWIGHWDGYAPTRNNYYLHFDGDGVLRLMPWGTDQTFFRALDFHGGRGRLMETCMRSAACRDLFDDALAQTGEIVVSLDLPAKIRALAATLAPWQAADVRKAYDQARIDGDVERTLNFINQRITATTELVHCLIGPDADPDGDGFKCDADCDNNDPLTFPGAPEICDDGRDQDCNGAADDAFYCPDCVAFPQGDHRYYVCPTPRTYAEAVDHCAAEDADLVQISSAAENTWVLAQAQTLRSQTWWLGLNDLETEGVFVWTVDGSEPVFESWNRGEPNDSGGEDCGELRGNGTWNDIGCDRRRGVLCEAPCDPVDADGDGAFTCGGDCDDDDPARFPGAEEICGDQIDQDCDGAVDEGAACTCVPRSRDGSDYLFCLERAGWPAARLACQERGMDLVVIDDQAEQDWTYQTAVELRRGDYWIGLNDIEDEGNFSWVDGSPLAFEVWNGNEPNNAGGRENCAHFWGNNGRWNDLPCSNPIFYICEAPN